MSREVPVQELKCTSQGLWNEGPSRPETGNVGGVTSQVTQGNLNETSSMERSRLLVRSMVPHDV